MRFFVSILVIVSFSCSNSREFELKSGDILFQDLDCGAYCESIETVTKGYNGAHLSHCGIAVKQKEKWYVTEAISQGVVLTPIDSFLARSFDQAGNPKVLVGRFKEESPKFIEAGLNRALTYLGRPYDWIYSLNDSSLYCSELVYYSFLKSGQPLFETPPMTFKAQDSDSTFKEWEGYFKDLGIPIPEGQPGLNPGSISLSQKVEIVYAYGYPEGYEPSVK